MTMTGGIVGMMTLFNGVTGGSGWAILLFILGFTMFLGLKTINVTDSLIYTAFFMSIVGILLFFVQLIEAYILGVVVGILMLSLLFKILFK